MQDILAVPVVIAVSGFYLFAVFGTSLLAGVGLAILCALINYACGVVLHKN